MFPFFFLLLMFCQNESYATQKINRKLILRLVKHAKIIIREFVTTERPLINIHLRTVVVHRKLTRTLFFFCSIITYRIREKAFFRAFLKKKLFRLLIIYISEVVENNFEYVIYSDVV